MLLTKGRALLRSFKGDFIATFVVSNPHPIDLRILLKLVDGILNTSNCLSVCSKNSVIHSDENYFIFYFQVILHLHLMETLQMEEEDLVKMEIPAKRGYRDLNRKCNVKSGLSLKNL